MNVKQYLASIGRKGGKAGTGKAKARTRKQAQAAARMRWANELAKKQAHGMKHAARHLTVLLSIKSDVISDISRVKRQFRP